MADRCTSCNARIIWATNPETGKRAPYDATPAGVGFVLLMEDGKPIKDSAGYGELTMGQKHTVFVNHFVTCPSRDQHRRTS